MTDIKDKTVVEEPTEEPKAEDKPVVDVKPVEEPKAEESVSGAAASTDDVATPAGTDQQGRQLYSVKCANCGKQTEVPFKPSGDRPVYCRDCYMQKKGGGV
jgi:CxxC-x17-CxxC domain-containing protein